MKRLLLTFIIGHAVVGRLSAQDANADAVQKALAAASEEYDRALLDGGRRVAAELNKKADAARQAGQLKAFEKYETEAKEFGERGRLPRSVPTAAYELDVRKAKAKLEAAYDVAVKVYTKNGDIERAKVTRQELADFLNVYGSSKDSRSLWVGDTTTLARDEKGAWVETPATLKVQFHFKEVGRTSDYVQLYDEKRQTTLRLTPTKVVMAGGNGRWELVDEGGWAVRKR